MKIPQYQIDESVATEATGFSFQRYIAWSAKVDTNDPRSMGHFILSAQELAGMMPQPGWEVSPDQDLVLARMIRCQLLAVRRRKIITDENDTVHFYPWFTPRREMVEGRFTSQVQVLLRLASAEAEGEAMPDLWVLSLKGFSKTMSWDNPGPEARYHNANFPTGVLPKVIAYLKEQAEQFGLPRPYPIFTLWVDLVPAIEGNRPLHVRVGSGSRSSLVNPFTVNLGPSQLWPIESRWVSPALVEEAQEILRRDPGWIKWESSVMMDELALPSEPSLDAEEDEIVPF